MYLLNDMENLLRSNQFYGILSNTGTNDKMNNSLFSMLKIFAISSDLFNGTLPKSFFENLRSIMTNSSSSFLTISSEYTDHPLYYGRLVTRSQGYCNKGLDMDLEKNHLAYLIPLICPAMNLWGKFPKRLDNSSCLICLTCHT
jgi:hypothetical protein